MIRDAKFQDIPGIITLMQAAYQRTHYARDGLAEMDVAEAKKLLLASIQRHGHKRLGATWVQVAETGGVITGLILGTLHRVYVVGNKLMATDLFWFASPTVDPKDPPALMRGMIEWAESCPDVIEIRCGVTGIISEDTEKPGVVLERNGLAKYGTIYRKEIRS